MVWQFIDRWILTPTVLSVLPKFSFSWLHPDEIRIVQLLIAHEGEFIFGQCLYILDSATRWQNSTSESIIFFILYQKPEKSSCL